jgi:cystathionine beta-synthase
MYYKNILETIGNTPMIELHKVCKEVDAKVLAKVDFFNPGNSIKDRMALKMIDVAEKKGKLKPGGTIIESTSGNTGMGLAMAGIVRGYRCIFTTNDKQSKEKVDILRAVGAEVIVCPTNVSADDPRSYYSIARKLEKEIPNSIYVNQYDNLANREAHYETTGPEIWEQTEGKVTHLVVGVGTGGTISGCGKYLKEKNPEIKIWGIDTYGSTLKEYHETGEIDESAIYSYITEGIGEDIIPECVDFSVIDHFEKVTDKDGAVMAREITKKEGIFVGYSAGSAVAGLNQLKDQLSKDDLVVVVFHDHGSRYVGKIYNDDWMRDRQFIPPKEILAADILLKKSIKEFISIEAEKSLHSAIELMQQKDISQLPVVKNGDIVGSLTEHLILKSMLDSNEMDIKIGDIMNPAFPVIDVQDSCQEISSRINKENSAVMVKDISGDFHIITEYDLIQAMA